MADKHTPQQRSYNMSQVKSKNTKPELMVRKFLFSQGFRYRLHDKKLPGKPDMVLPKYKTVIFVHGCFFHGHEGCKYATIPQTRTEWWQEKINGNRRRDGENEARLSALGWRIITLYECELKPAQREQTLQRLGFRVADRSEALR
ncbi:very short patch repair endonuclease [Runella slithyformis]|uniref:Very short patch repair endonuclease n=1 Tax=Runella slithyformis (strain ATCC 29530 / DSM 19594 / LMG 11500 / NCIMB 11436 / LSU 4) TaxID=761193 RepID=A0A7U3ZJL0_RUNSL|nr:very short patch repair endonuclease [Runella slithyformis]AEI48387.1 DNA mismatch endonuclease Vsr [Runella slithyformis DSM 19594]